VRSRHCFHKNQHRIAVLSGPGFPSQYFSSYAFTWGKKEHCIKRAGRNQELRRQAPPKLIDTFIIHKERDFCNSTWNVNRDVGAK
jgi:hypothetical protein